MDHEAEIAFSVSDKCKVPDGISLGEPLKLQLPGTHDSDRSIEPEETQIICPTIHMVES